jgi:hypothetical protein
MTISAPSWTVLGLTGMGVVPYSTRNATQSLAPIDQAAANVYRDVNGVLRSTAGGQFFKYRSEIKCTDQRPFSVDGVWPGRVITVSCIATLAYEDSSAAQPQRTPVVGSEVSEGGWIIYRPILEMMVLDFAVEEDEYGAAVSWSMRLEEV